MSMLSRRTLPRFALAEPETLAEALSFGEEEGGSAQMLAGGIHLLSLMRSEETSPGLLVSLGRIDELHGIRRESGSTEIGAMATLREIETYLAVRTGNEVLRQAIESIISVQVKNVATALGNLCVGTPASDVAAALIALDASCRIASRAGQRIVPMREFFVGPGETVVKPGEIVTAVVVPPAPPGMAGGFSKMVRTATDIAKVSAAVCLTVQDGVCTNARIGLAAVAPTPIRASNAEERLRGSLLTEDVVREASLLAQMAVCPIDDIRSTAAYRRRMVPVVVSRAIHQAMEDRR